MFALTINTDIDEQTQRNYDTKFSFLFENLTLGNCLTLGMLVVQDGTITIHNTIPDVFLSKKYHTHMGQNRSGYGVVLVDCRLHLHCLSIPEPHSKLLRSVLDYQSTRYHILEDFNFLQI